MKNALLIVASLLVFAPTAKADELVQTNQFVLFGGFGGGGQRQFTTTTRVLGAEVTADTQSNLETSYLLGGRYEGAISDYFGLGAHLEWTRFGSQNDAHPDNFFDAGLDPYVGFSFGNELRIEPRIVVPLGYTLYILNEADRVKESDGGFGAVGNGFHVGALGGVALRHRRGFGGLLELGFMHHQTYDTNGTGNIDVRMKTNQFVVHFGVSIDL